MKLLVAVVVIAMAIQISLAAEPLGRSKRSAQFADDIKVLATLGKRLIPLTESVVEATIPKIPKTHAYKKYKRQLRRYLANVDEYYSQRGGCYAKTFELVEKFRKLVEPYTEDNAPAEAMNLATLMSRRDGSTEMNSVLAEYTAVYNNSNFPVAWQHMSTTDLQLIMPLLQEVC